MKTKNQEEAKERTQLTRTLEKMDDECRRCHPLNPIKCVSRCNIWRLRNELRRLSRVITHENYNNMLLNTLKNKRRLQILETLSKHALSITQLQKEMKKQNYHHSQRTIINEYVKPLIAAGLVTDNSSRYKATTFGCEISQLFNYSHMTENALPPHSKCYEEKTIETLSESPKAYEELGSLIPTESLSRILKRLQDANLIIKDSENRYIYYFKTKRNPQQEKLSPTERRIYENIPEEGITAKKLADKTNISSRRTYKYLRRLRGKKLAFRRKRPKTYALTAEGMKVAKLLEKMHVLIMEFTQALGIFTTKHLEVTHQIPVPEIFKNRRRKPLQISVSVPFRNEK